MHYFCKVFIEKSEFIYNLALGSISNGGGIFLWGQSMLNLQNSILRSNKAHTGADCGGEDSSLIIADSSVASNSALRGAGVFAYIRCSLSITNTDFVSNIGSGPRIADNCGALHISDSSANIENSKFLFNTAIRGGGAISMFKSNLEMDDSEGRGNAANEFGGSERVWRGNFHKS